MSFFAHTPGTAIAIRFLRDYAEFGCRSHLITSQALSNQLAITTDAPTRKIVAVKHFAELISAIEDLAGMCIAIKHREEGSGLLYSFITYDTSIKGAPRTTTREFYQALYEGQDLIKFLGLPDYSELKTVSLKLEPELQSQIAQVLIERGQIQTKEELDSARLLKNIYDELPKVFSSVSKTMLLDGEILRRAYNQTKHGFKVIQDPKVFALETTLSDQQCLIMVKNPDYVSGEKVSGKILEFSQVDIKDFPRIAGFISLVTGAMRILCLLVATLLESGAIKSADDQA